MNTPRRDPAELAALLAERDHFGTVDDVLSDMFDAAFEVTQQKSYRDCAAEDAKRRVWEDHHKPVMAGYFAAADAYREERFGSEYAEDSRTRLDGVYAHDPEMRALLDKARADLAARRKARTPAERDRRRSR
ncbi:hypothetical protein H0264_18535 [Nocardia huaxiensis]|uniref:Uncharacterized protein n=1 Tax=Nocardia huaxiensis TaxID=2755382 RepID=A0A7D6ZHU0_9NOCA|nr:hypothetical protein [Nocardia huaxiensis]QLY33958.1 hypothetical protein H0264_18535 [Nocardia huaxiensis]